MSATATMTNGKSRKQLSDEIDRLDGVIDVLAEGLPGAVTDACREGARAAVKDAIIEIVTNPELRALLAPGQPALAAVAVGANIGRWWLSRHGSVASAVGLGVLATGLGLAGGPVARAALAVLAAATDLLSAESALARIDPS